MERSFDTNGQEQPTASEAAYDVAGEPRSAPGAQAGRERREIAAQDVRNQCLQGQFVADPGGACRECSSNQGGHEVAFEDKTITGQLDLKGVLLDRPVRFTECVFTDPIDLTGARAAKGIRLERCTIRSLKGDRLSVDGDLLLERVDSDGEISLCGARLTGHLRCTGSKFSPPSGRAFIAKGMMVGGSALFDGGFSSAGEFILTSARIGGTADMSGGSFSNTVGPALVADGMRVGADIILSANFKGPVILKEAHVSGKVKCSGGRFVASPGEMAINAELIEADGICLDADFRASGQVHLDGSTVTGRLLCTGGRFCNRDGIALSANSLDCQDVRLGHGFTATGEVQLMGARISRELNCTNGIFDNDKGVALRADGLICDGRIYLNENFKATGEVILRNARIETELSCTGGRFCNLDGIALRANGLDCRTVRLGHGFTATGEVQLMGARISRELNCTNGIFDNDKGVALRADGLICDGKIYLNAKFKAIGVVRLCNARITTELNCSNGTFEDGEGVALDLGGLTCDGNVYLNEDFRAIGKVELVDATVGRELNCEKGKFGKLVAQRLVVGAKFLWKPSETKEVDLDFASVGLLRDHMPTSWPKGKTQVAGFTFMNLGEDSPVEAKKRIDFLRHEKYAPGIYQQLTQIYRKKGFDREADKIAIVGQRLRRKGGGTPWPSRVWSGFLEHTVGYGYKMHRPLIFVFVWGAVGGFFFLFAQRNHLMVPVSGAPAGGQKATIDANSCPSGSKYPCFMPFIYSFELLLPVVNLRQVMFWLPSAVTGWGRWLLADVWVSVVVGWMVSAAILAGIGHLFSQRN